MRKPVIGIVGRTFLEKDGNSVIELNEDYRLAVVRAGGIPIEIIPINDLKYGERLPSNAGNLTEENKKDLDHILKLCDGFLMTGGTRWYYTDEIICKYALDNDIPILGICLGMQILGNVDNFSGTQNSDKTIKNKTLINHSQPGQKYVHKNKILEGPLYDILKVDEISVNSRHNYHIIPKEWFHIDSYSEDGLIEAIDIPNHKFALGVQWHPENMIEYEPNMLKIFTAFISACQDK